VRGQLLSLSRQSVWAWECYLCQRISFPFPEDQMSHPLGNITMRFKMSDCLTDWTWQWAPLTQPHTGFLLPASPVSSGLGGPVSLSLLSRSHCGQVLWTAVVADTMIQMILGCLTSTLSSEQRWMDTGIKMPGLGCLAMFVHLCRERIFLIR